MSLSNTATPYYYGKFRDAVIRGDIPVCREISMEMNRIDDLIANPGVWYADQAINGFIEYCNNELVLTDGEDLELLDSFKLWAEQIFGWYYFVEMEVYRPNRNGPGGHYVKKMVKKKEKESGWEFLYLAANIDAVSTGAVMGFREDRSVNYKASAKGTEHMYEAVGCALNSMRSNMAVDKCCFEQLEEDARS